MDNGLAAGHAPSFWLQRPPVPRGRFGADGRPNRARLAYACRRRVVCPAYRGTIHGPLPVRRRDRHTAHCGTVECPWCDPSKRHLGTTATRTNLAVAWPSARRHGPHDAVDDLWTSACAVRIVAISRESWIRSRWGLSPIRRRIVSLSLASATPYECAKNNI